MPITAPRKLGDHLFASGIGAVGVLLKLDDSKPAVKEVWRGNSRTIENVTGRFLLLLHSVVFSFTTSCRRLSRGVP